MRTRLLATTGFAAVLALSSVVAPAAGAGAAPAPAPRATGPVADAVAWLVDQQQADGGFELAGFPGFETADAALALAAAGQTGPTWDTAEARAAVEAVTTGGAEPKDALDALDDWVDDVQGDPGATVAAKAQQAAKVIVLVTEPLGLDAEDFDPSGDSEEPVDLVAALQAGAGGDGAFAGLPFLGRAYGGWATAALGLDPSAALVADLLAAQRANGSWNYLGDPSVPGFDVDGTAIVSTALVAMGEGAAVLPPALGGLGLVQRWNGEWAGEFDDGSPNSTAQVMLLAATLGSNPGTPCWRDAAEARAAGVRYPSPVRSLVRRQTPDGNIASPDDGWGVNTFATTQAVQALVAAEGPWPYRGEGCSSTTSGNSRRLVNAHYADLLSRYSDEAGAQHWVGQLDGGLSPAQVSRRLSGTPEYGRRVVGRLAQRYLGRAASSVEQTAGGSMVLAGRRLDVMSVFLGLDEYYDATGFPATDTTWVDAVYLDALGRPADAAGRTWALGQLAAGRTRIEVARSLVGSTEGLSHLVTGFYQDLLRRGTDAAGRDFWVGEIRRGRSPEGLVMLIAGSGEYVAATRAPA